MKNIILEEINRFRFLSNYDNAKTSVENIVNLTEGLPGEALLRALESDRGFLSSFKGELDSMKELGVQSRDLKTLKTSEAIIDAIKAGKLEPAELGRVNWAVLKNTKDAKLAETLTKDITSNKTFMKGAAGKSQSEFIEALKNKGISEGKSKLLWKSYQSNLKELEDLKDLKDVKDVKDTKDVKDVKDVESEVKADKDLRDADEIKAKENLSKADKLGKEEANLERQISDAEREARIRENRDYLNKLKDEKPNVVLDWFRRNRLIQWAKRSIPWKTLLILGAIGGAGYLAWYYWFKDKGFKIECPEGEEVNPANGKCERGGGAGGSEKTIDPNDPDIINETDPSKFIECSGIYKLGCKGDDISKVQDCLGINTTGLFGKPTEDALYKRINRRTFTKDDIKTICTFQAPNITRI
jgi:hypothetical protein